jgi:hypothetical protein
MNLLTDLVDFVGFDSSIGKSLLALVDCALRTSSLSLVTLSPPLSFVGQLSTLENGCVPTSHLMLGY